MKVIIELSENVRIENVASDDDLVRIVVRDHHDIVKIDELKIALRKLTAK